tara:strand:- start:18493 stop:18876 length:384 start_codon:yes stop_codon:yes gene_type:complete
MDYLFYYLFGSMVAASITFTICVTSVFKSFRELVSRIHPKIEELIHCPWCLGFWVLLTLLCMWDIKPLYVHEHNSINLLFTLFMMYTMMGVFHYVLLRAYKPVMEHMAARAKVKRFRAKQNEKESRS